MQATTYTAAQANKSHNTFAKATLFKNGIEQTTPLNLDGGNVQVDASAAVRRRCKLKLRGYHPEIDPFTCELKPYRSVDDEYVPLGVFRIEDPTFSEDRDGIVTEIEGYDRAYWLASLRLVNPYSITGGTQVHTAIANLLTSRAPGLVMNFMGSNYTVPATTFEEMSDPWEKALSMAESAGMELFFDALGVCVLRPVPTDIANIVTTFGGEARILKISKKQSTKNTYSRAIVTGENTNVTTPIRSEKVDIDPNSPTYYLGTFGDRPTWLRSQFITTQAQADEAASALLARKSGRAEVVAIEGIPNASLDANDMVRIYRPELGLDAICALDTIDIPLSIKSAMRLGTRERRVL